MSERLGPFDNERELARLFPHGGIELHSGCMFSGKTDALINQLYKAQMMVDINVRNGRIDSAISSEVVKAFKPSIDVRYGTDAKLHSHSGAEWPAVLIDGNVPEEILIHIGKFTRVIGIDEGQFCDRELISVCESLARRGIRVIISALDADFRGETFGFIGDLWARADKKEQTTALCMTCGETATKTQRLFVEKDANGKVTRRPSFYDEPTVVVGADEMYEARCRTHHQVPKRPINRNG